jgi:hypothetical protein
MATPAQLECFLLSKRVSFIVMKSENAIGRFKSSSSWVSRLQEKGRSAILLNITLQRDIIQKGDSR